MSKVALAAEANLQRILQGVSCLPNLLVLGPSRESSFGSEAVRGDHQSHGTAREPEIVAMTSAFDSSYFERPLRDLPKVNAEEYTDEELGRELFRAGVSNKNVEDILAALRQAERLIGWYQDNGSGRKPHEYEVVSHIVLPLFLFPQPLQPDTPNFAEYSYYALR